ncbi:hypothetical protein GCM10020001_017830 [Nonomuraea salmonea]
MRQRAIRNLAKLELTQARVTRILDAAAGGKNHFTADLDAVRRYDLAAPPSPRRPPVPCCGSCAGWSVTWPYAVWTSS